MLVRFLFVATGIPEAWFVLGRSVCRIPATAFGTPVVGGAFNCLGFWLSRFGFLTLPVDFLGMFRLILFVFGAIFSNMAFFTAIEANKFTSSW